MRLLLSALLGGSLVLSVPATLHAQDGGQDKNTCPKSPKQKSAFGSFLGNLGASVIDQRLGRAGIPLGAMRSTLNVALIDLFACKLKPDERDKAATATTSVVEKPVGSRESWASTSRPGVTGSSAVVAQTKLADGSVCKDVRDVATIDGEETTVTKRMCRAPGATGYRIQPQNA